MAMNRKRSTKIALVAAVMMIAGMIVLALTGPAAAQGKDPYSNRGPKVLPQVIERDTPDRPQVIDDSSRREGELPFTGADLTLFMATGLAAVATGTVIVRRTRTRSSVQ